MNNELCDIKNMLFEVMASVRHLEGVVASLTKEAKAHKNGNKEEKEKEKKSSPTPLSIEKQEIEEKGVVVGELSAYTYARPRSVEEVDEYITNYCRKYKNAIAGVIDGQEVFDLLEEKNWKERNGELIKDWKAVVRRIIRYRSQKYLIKREDLNNKARLENLRHQNIMEERGKKVAAQPAVGHVEVNRPKFLDEKIDTQGGIQRYNELLAQGYTPEQISKMGG